MGYYGADDSLIPFKSSYKEIFVGGSDPLMFVVKNDKSVGYNNGVGTLSGNYISCVYTNYNATFTALQNCKVGYRIGGNAYTEKTVAKGQQITNLNYGSGQRICLFVI